MRINSTSPKPIGTKYNSLFNKLREPESSISQGRFRESKSDYRLPYNPSYLFLIDA
jgi:hypothetical protein